MNLLYLNLYTKKYLIIYTFYWYNIYRFISKPKRNKSKNYGLAIILFDNILFNYYCINYNIIIDCFILLITIKKEDAKLLS